MSKLTLDEAIKHCLEAAEKNETTALRIGRQYKGTLLDREAKECRECAEDHRQLAEWLTELKEVRSKMDACNILAVDAFAVENLCKELKEAKRLLRLAVEDNTRVLRENFGDICQFCKHYSNSEAQCCKPHNGSGSWCCENAEWRYAAEALALIGGSENE